MYIAAWQVTEVSRDRVDPVYFSSIMPVSSSCFCHFFLFLEGVQNSWTGFELMAAWPHTSTNNHLICLFWYNLSEYRIFMHKNWKKLQIIFSIYKMGKVTFLVLSTFSIMCLQTAMHKLGSVIKVIAWHIFLSFPTESVCWVIPVLKRLSAPHTDQINSWDQFHL